MRRLISFLAGAFVLCGFGLFSENGTVNEFKLDNSGVVEYPRPGTPLACWDYETAVAGTYDDDCSGVPYTMTVVGAPTQEDDATWPNLLGGAQGEAWRFSGANQYLTRASDGTFAAAGDFSVQCIVTPDIVSVGERAFAAKWNAGTANRCWMLEQSATNVIFYLSDDGTAGGGALSNATSAGVLSAHQPAFVTASYDWRTDGTSVMNVYVDDHATATNAAANGPTFAGNALFTMAADGSGLRDFDGLIHGCTYWDGLILSEADHDDAFSRWQGRTSSAGDSVRVNVASAAPPAIIVAAADSGTEPFLVDQTANSFSVGSPEAGSGGMYGAAAISNLCFRSSLETWAAGSPTGWAETIAGGTSDATQSTTPAHAGSSAQMFCDGVNNVSLDSGCTAMAAATAYYLSGFFQTTVGAANFSLQLIEYTDAACTVGAVTTTVYNGDPGANWIKQGGTRTTGGAVQSGQVRLLMSANNATILADAIQLRAAATPTDAYAGCDTDAACVTNLVDASVIPPITAGNWQMEATVRSPIDGAVGAPARNLLYIPGTAGNNNRVQVSWASDVLTCSVYDAAGVIRSSTVAAAGNSDQDYEILVSKSDEGIVQCCWDGTCDATPATLALTDGVGAELVLGSQGITGGDAWVRNLVTLRRIR